MSKYNSYAKSLNMAFRQAKEEYDKAYDAYNKAAAGEETAKAFVSETYTGERDAKIARAHAEVIETKAALDAVTKNAWGTFKLEQERLTKELTEEVKKDFIISPGAVDAQAVELLKSGIMGPEDMRAMVELFKDNPTMLRYIRQSAENAAKDNKNDADLRQAYNIILSMAKGQDDIILENWQALTTAGLTYSGLKHSGAGGNTPGLISSLSAHWEDANVQDAINNF